MGATTVDPGRDRCRPRRGPLRLGRGASSRSPSATRRQVSGTPWSAAAGCTTGWGWARSRSATGCGPATPAVASPPRPPGCSPGRRSPSTGSAASRSGADQANVRKRGHSAQAGLPAGSGGAPDPGRSRRDRSPHGLGHRRERPRGRRRTVDGLTGGHGGPRLGPRGLNGRHPFRFGVGRLGHASPPCPTPPPHPSAPWCLVAVGIGAALVAAGLDRDGARLGGGAGLVAVRPGGRAASGRAGGRRRRPVRRRGLPVGLAGAHRRDPVRRRRVVIAVVTALLNLDTSVVFLTPVLVHAARSRGQ